MQNDIKKNMEIMKKVIEEKKAKSLNQKKPKIPPTYGKQSPGSGNIK